MIIENIFKSKENKETLIETICRIKQEVPKLFVGKKYKIYQTAIGDKPFPVAIKTTFASKYVSKGKDNRLHVSTIMEKTLSTGEKFYELALYMGNTANLIEANQMFRLKIIGTVGRSNITISTCSITYEIRQPWVDGMTELKKLEK